MAPRTQPAAVRRQALLDAGQRAFVEKGIAAATVDDITNAAGVAKGTFYLYFESKEHLLGALRERFVDRFMARLAALMAAVPEEDWPARLDTWVAAFIRGYLDNAELHDILFQVADLPSGVNTGLPRPPAGNRPAEALTALLEEGVAAGCAVCEDVAVTATLLYSALHGAVHHALHYSENSETADGRDAARLIGVSQGLFRRSLMPWTRAGPRTRAGAGGALP